MNETGQRNEVVAVEIPRTNPTMADVATAAGVSHQTVSRVLNNPASVPPRTRDRVQDAVARLGYHRNMTARALATGNTHTIGVLITSATFAGPSGTLMGIEKTARAAGYWVSMAGLDSDNPREAQDAFSHFINQGVTGIIAIIQTQSALDATLDASLPMPVAFVTSGFVPDSQPCVDFDQADAVRQVMSILRGLGHTQVAHISGPLDDLHAAIRKTVWQESLVKGLDNQAMCQIGDWSAASGYRATLDLLAANQMLTAIFAGNDQMALGALRALGDAGLDVPRDMSIVGFDDSVGSDNSIPPLTTIRQNRHALGQVAVELLLAAIEGQPAQHLRIPAELVLRASTGAPNN